LVFLFQYNYLVSYVFGRVRNQQAVCYVYDVMLSCVAYVDSPTWCRRCGMCKGFPYIHTCNQTWLHSLL